MAPRERRHWWINIWVKEDGVRDVGVTNVISALGGKCQKLSLLLGLSEPIQMSIMMDTLMTHHLKIFSKRSDGKEQHFLIWTRDEKMSLSFGAGLWLSRLHLFYLVPPTARSSPCPPGPIGLAGHDVDHVWCADSAHFLCITPASVGSVHRFLTVTEIWTSGMKPTFLLSSHPTIKSCPIKKIKMCLRRVITLMLFKLLF